MIEFFHHLNALYPLSAEAQAALMKVIRAKELRKGQVWLQEGAVCDKLTFVIKGLTKLYFETGSKEVILHFARGGEFCLSAQSYFDQRPSRYIIRAAEPTVVISIAYNEMQQLIERYHELNVHLKLIAQKQAELLEEHLAMLLLPPRERYENLKEQYLWMEGRLTDRLLAAFIGVTPNCISYYRNGRWDERRRGW